MMNDEDVAIKTDNFATFQWKTIQSVAFYHLLQSITCLEYVSQNRKEKLTVASDGLDR